MISLSPSGGDDTASVQAAFASAAASGGKIIANAGRYNLSSSVPALIAANKGLAIDGDGQDVTEFLFTGNHGFDIRLGRNASFYPKDFSILAGAAGGGRGLKISSANVGTPADAVSELKNICIRSKDDYRGPQYFDLFLDIVNASNINFDNVNLVGDATNHGNGLHAIGDVATGSYTVQLNLAKCNIIGMNKAVIYDSFVQGVALSQTNLTGCVWGIVTPAGALGELQLLAVVACQIACGGPGFSGGGAMLFETVLSGLYAAANEIGVVANSDAIAGRIVSPEIVGNRFLSGGVNNNAAINIWSGGGGSIAKNSINSVARGIVYGGAAVTVMNDVQADNTFNGVATPFVPNGSAQNPIPPNPNPPNPNPPNPPPNLGDQMQTIEVSTAGPALLVIARANQAAANPLILGGGLHSALGDDSSSMLNFVTGNNSAYVGQVKRTNAGGTILVSPSDERLKTNIRDAVGGLERLREYKVRDFSMKNDPSMAWHRGFIAQEVWRIKPDAVSVGSPNPSRGEAKEGDEGFVPWMMDYGRITPDLTLAAQELDKKVRILSWVLSAVILFEAVQWTYRLMI